MKDINRIKKMIRVVVYAIGFGLIIGGGIGIAYLNKIDKEYISTIARIENIEKYHERYRNKTKTRYEVTVSYVVKDTIFTKPLGIYTSLMTAGDEIAIMYNPDNPTQIHSISNEKIRCVILMIAGVFNLIIAYFILPKILLISKIPKQLLYIKQTKTI